MDKRKKTGNGKVSDRAKSRPRKDLKGTNAKPKTRTTEAPMKQTENKSHRARSVSSKRSSNTETNANKTLESETGKNRKQSNRKSTKRKLDTRYQDHLSGLENSSSSPDSDVDSEADKRPPSKKKKHRVAKITFGNDSSSQSESSDFDSGDSDMQQLGNTFARNIVHPEMNQKGITLDSLSYQYAEPISTPISAQIPTKLKKKIWKKRYIDIGLLLPKVNLQPDFQKFSLEVSPNADINLVPKSKTKKIFSIELWTTAFLCYIAVYTEKFPGENQQLLKYCEIIRDLAQRKHGLAWSHYDQNFRLLRENFPVPWDRIHTEYWIKAATSTVSDPPRQQPKSFHGQQDQLFRGQQDTRTRFLAGTCWKYNKHGQCGIQSCKFEHKCGICRGLHAAGRCSRVSRPDKSASTNDLQNLSSATTSQNKQPNRPSSGT